MKNDKLQEECLQYFRSFPVFGRLLKGFYQKYLSYGSFSGTVTLSNLTLEDREALEGFFQKNYHGKKSASISAQKFEQALKDSRFAEISGKEVLELYFGGQMEGKKEKQLRQQKAWEEMFEEMIFQFGEAGGDSRKEKTGYRETKCEKETGDCGKKKKEEGRQEERKAGEKAGEIVERWLREIENPQKGTVAHYTAVYLKRYHKEAGEMIEKTRQLLRLGCRILCELCQKTEEHPEYVAVFAARLTGNPHAFDDGTTEAGLLSLIIRWLTQIQKTEEIFPAIHRQKRYLSVGIMRDDVSNYVMISSVRARKKDGSMHQGLESFYEEGDMLHLPLSVLVHLKEALCVDREIYMVENPSVYAMLCGKWKKKRSLMCMNGQPRISAVLMLDLLAASQTTIYYAGDFDPEGLMIAQKVKKYYCGKSTAGTFHFWHLSCEDYRKAISSEKISEKRLKMMEHIDDPKLQELAEEILKTKKAGYQENILMEFLSIETEE